MKIITSVNVQSYGLIHFLTYVLCEYVNVKKLGKGH